MGDAGEGGGGGKFDDDQVIKTACINKSPLFTLETYENNLVLLFITFWYIFFNGK